MATYKQMYELAGELYDLLPRGEIDRKVLQIVYSRGMLRLEQLKTGHIYIGKCRGSYMAQWNGENFIIARWEMTNWILEDVPHPEHDMRYDIFVPVFNLTLAIGQEIFGE